MLMSLKRNDADYEQLNEKGKAMSKLLVPPSYALSLIIADASLVVKPKQRLLLLMQFKCRSLKCCSN